MHALRRHRGICAPWTHPDDRFHPPENDDPFWTETCWFTFAVPGGCGPAHPFFRKNQGVTSSAAVLWDDETHQLHDCTITRIGICRSRGSGPDRSPSRERLHYKCLEPLSKYELHYLDPDRNEIEIHLTYDSICEPNRLGGGHLDQPPLYRHDPDRRRDDRGRRLRDARPLLGLAITDRPGLHPPTIATAGTPTRRCRTRMPGTSSPPTGTGTRRHPRFPASRRRLVEARRRHAEVLERRTTAPRTSGSPAKTSWPDLEEGRPHNKFGVHLNPNLWTWNCLTDWQWDDGKRGWAKITTTGAPPPSAASCDTARVAASSRRRREPNPKSVRLSPAATGRSARGPDDGIWRAR